MNGPSCRTCGARTSQCVGVLPDGYSFAGNRTSKALPGGRLWRCTDCGFMFRDPLLSEDLYEDLYRNGSLGLWDTDQSREDFRLIREQLLPSEGRVLDVADIGCYTGQLLTSLPKSFRIFGVEPNKEAARVAAAHGVAVIADTLRDFARTGERYDVITACDVIEHVPNPLELLVKLRNQLKPAGRIVVTTGNCDAWLWRLVGAGYWYCHFPEHISFIGSHWVRTMPRRAALQLTGFIPFNYRGGAMRVSRLLATVLHRLSPSTYRILRPGPRGSSGEAVPPGNGATRDHMLCVFEAA